VANDDLQAGLSRVAALAGVSRATVSRTFGRPEVVNPATRSRVLAAARQIGYRPHSAQTAHRPLGGHSIGLFVPDIANPYFPPFIKEVQAKARQRGYAVLVADSDEHAENEEGIVTDVAGRTDGLIAVSARMSDEALRRITNEHRVMLVSRHLAGHAMGVEQSDEGVRQAVEHLRALGHQSILYMAGPAGSRSNRIRLDAISAAAAELGIDLSEIGPFEPRYEAGERAIDLVLALRPTAIIAYNDLIALGLIAQMTARGLRVGADVSVVGIDDIWLARLATPALTSVRVPLAESATRAVGILLDVLEGRSAPPESPIEIPTRLIVRATTGPRGNLS
jgi:LacI family transcriptional regulator